MKNILPALIVIATAGISIRVFAQSERTVSDRAARIHKSVNQVLSAPEFAPLKTRNAALENVGKSATNFLSRLFEWLGKFFRFGGGGAQRSSSVMLYPLMAILIAGLAYIAAYVVLRRTKGGEVSKRPRRSKSTVLDLEREDSRDSDEWLNAARSLAANQEYLQALRAVFVATLLRLDAAGIVTYEQSRTNGEYLRATRRNPHFFRRFQGIVRSFDAGWYGNSPVTEADYAAAMEGYRDADTLAAEAHRA